MDPTPESRAVYKVARRILPFLFILYLSAFIDRVNLGFAAVNFQKDLHLSNAAYGFGAGMFFIGYFLFEIPSNLILERTGARKWIARIMFTWAIISGSMMFVRTAHQFYFCRFMLGVAEAGFFPGMILYLTYWFPAAHRARAVSKFMIASPLASVIGSPISLAIMKYVPGFFAHLHTGSSAISALKGWQWLFMLEAVPSFLLTFVVLFYLTDKPVQARWLDADEKTALTELLIHERADTETRQKLRLLQAFWVILRSFVRYWLRVFTEEAYAGELRQSVRLLSTLFMLTALYFCMNVGNYGLDFWLPIIMKGFKTIDTSKPNIYSMLPYIAAAIGMVVIGTHSDKTRERRLHIFYPCAVSSIAMLGFAWFQGKSPFGGLLCITVAAVGPRAILGPFWTLPPVFLTGTSLAGGIAFINSIGNLGGLFGPSLLGKLKDVTGSFVPGIVMLATAILLTGLLGLCTGRDVHVSVPGDASECPRP